MIVMSSVRLSCSSHSLYDSLAMTKHASLGSAYLFTYNQGCKQENLISELLTLLHDYSSCSLEFSEACQKVHVRESKQFVLCALAKKEQRTRLS